ncbi:hypothetical protein QNI23_013470 [Bermanella sp. WJH001]|uniref:hypothetical protein n=1 Tax=Bermanella sp. WJH001 TaxID=3048005 RepID=UPI0024BD8359|nr:hypothetical protein [Bermanella sp. WJH001]MDJ1538001.1 hypothetical protein [Bermanella sp. WJH001]
MSDWFCVSAWYENGETEIHYEIANEDGEQYFFWIHTELLNEKLSRKEGSTLDKFFYAEEDMLALAVTILDEEMVEDMEHIEITTRLLNRYF